MHFYDFNIGDYAKKTQHLTNEEDLAYRRALDMYYDTEKPLLSGGLATLSRRLRVSQKALQNVLDEFFPDGRNKHADEKIAAYHAYLLKQAENGKKGGRPKNQVVTDGVVIDNKPTDNPPLSQKNPVPSQLLTTNHLPLTTKPLTTNQDKSKPIQATKVAAVEKDVDTDLQAACRETWKLYSLAFFNRYGTEPVRNKTVNSQVKGFVQRIGATEAPLVAEFYLSANTDWYVKKGHSFQCLLGDAEKVRTEWATGKTMTSTRATQIDRTQANFNAIDEAVKLVEERKHAKGN